MKMLAAFLLVASAATAEEAKKPSAAEQEMMEKWVKAGTPGPEHQKMAKMAGKWKAKVTNWMAPGAPPQTSDATTEYRTIMGGRYLEQEFHGTMGPDQPFEGHGIDGFDNVTKEHFGTWIDSMSTSAMILRGKCAEGKKCTLKGKMADPIAGKEVPVSTVMTVKDDNNFTWEMHTPGPDGKPFKSLEIVYTRAP
jgi:hypothetical protein